MLCYAGLVEIFPIKHIAVFHISRREGEKGNEALPSKKENPVASFFLSDCTFIERVNRSKEKHPKHMKGTFHFGFLILGSQEEEEEDDDEPIIKLQTELKFAFQAISFLSLSLY